MISLLPQKLRLLLSATAWTVLVATTSGEVLAQIKPTIQAIDKTQIRRDEPLRDVTNFPYWVSRKDCLADDELTFKVQVMTPNADQFEVWAGTADCTQKTERQGATANCWRLYSNNLSKSPANITIRAQDLVAQHSVVNGGGLDTPGTEEDCKPKYQATGLYFMYINDSGDISSNSVKFSETGVDTEGPLTPDITEVLPSDGRLIVKWDNNNPTEFAGYRLYCTAAVESETVESALTLADGAVVDGAAFDTSTSGATDVDTLTSTTGTGDAVSAATDGSGAAVPTDAGNVGGSATVDAGEEAPTGCGGSVLVEGQFPPASKLCGEVTTYSTTTGYAKKLVNGRNYAVGLTAVDRMGNESYLSNVACNSPREVFTFYEDYKEAGGGGGGGFCSVTRPSRASQPWQLWGLVSLAICLGLFRRINNT